MISAIQARDDYGRECWDVYEHDDDADTADVEFVRIARYRTSKEANAFIEGCGWPEYKMKLFGLKLEHAIRQEA